MYLTLQTAVAILVAVLLIPTESIIVMVVYVSLGLMGLPLFSSPGLTGLGYIFSPALGYLIGFILSAPLGSLYLNRKPSESHMTIKSRGSLIAIDDDYDGGSDDRRIRFRHYLVASLIVVAMIFCCGLVYTWGYSHYVLSVPSGLSTLLSGGIALLWIKDLLLAVSIAAIVPRLRRHIL
jgi:biotin transport system substrate-specific component